MDAATQLLDCHLTEERSEVEDLRCKVRHLEDDNRRLHQTIAQLQQQVEITHPEPVGAYYTLNQFMVALAARRRRTYGWRIDYAQATEQTPGCYRVSTDDIQKWQKEDRVPEQAFMQIDWLHYPVRAGKSSPKPEWKPHEVDFLITLCKANPSEPNASLAKQCAEYFERIIDEAAIKGKKHRLIRAGRLPECDHKGN